MILEKLTITDTFKQWRDKINAIINEYEGVPSTDQITGILTIDTDRTQADSFAVDIPSNFNNSVIFNDKVTVIDKSTNDVGEINAIATSTRKLHTKIRFNGTFFDGSQDIVTEHWGATRDIEISDYTQKYKGELKKVNGSENYILKMPDRFNGFLEGDAQYAVNLKTKRSIDGITFDGGADVIHYGVCSSDGGEQVKTVTIPNFVLKTGATVTVKFEKTNTSDEAKLNVNNTGAKPIYLRNKKIEPLILTDYSTYTFVYDGTNFNLVTGADNFVFQSKSAMDKEYPLLASPILDANNEGETTSSLFSPNIVINPSKNSISSNKFIANINATNSKNAFFVTKNKADVYNVIPNNDTIVRYLSYEDNTNHMLGVFEYQKNADGSRYSNIAVPMFDTNGEEYSWSRLQVGWTGGETPQPQINCNGNLFVKSNLIVDGNFTKKGDLIVDGNIRATKVHNAVWNDYAEFFEKGEETEAGDIVALDITSNEERYVKATEKSKLVVGIHSDTYGHILGGENSIEENEKTHIPVGLSGRVYVKFKGKSILGEGVVPSDTPGVGRLYDEFLDDKRKIVGYIVYDPEPSSPNERKVRVLINR